MTTLTLRSDKKCALEVEQPVEDLQQVLNSLADALQQAPLSYVTAPTEGIMLRIFLIREVHGPYTVFINPSFQPADDQKTTALETCSLFPSTCVPVARYEWIRAEWTTSAGERVNKILSGNKARVFQHACCHLDGKTILDGTPALKRQMLSRRAK